MAQRSRHMAAFTNDADVFLGFQKVQLSGHRLFIGPRESLANIDELKEQGITHILSTMQGASAIDVGSGSDFCRLVLDHAVDDPSCNLKADWPQCCQFVDGALQSGGGVLIHCDAGQSRSGATLIAYLVHHLQRPCGECLALAQRARSIVQPNEGFWAQLLSWERECLGSVCVPVGAHMHEIRPRLWLGSLEAAQDWQRLEECKITHIITCGRSLDTQLPAGVSRLCKLGIDDLEEVDILEHIPAVSDLIGKVLAESTSHKILVHCASGRSRSASMVIAFVMREEQLSYVDALESVQSVRSVVQPNTGFTHQLAWYGRNGFPKDLREASSGKGYREVPAFANLLRKYSKADVIALVSAAGVDGANMKDPKTLQRALNAIDRLQNAVPLDEEARNEKKAQSRRINAALDSV